MGGGQLSFEEFLAAPENWSLKSWSLKSLIETDRTDHFYRDALQTYSWSMMDRVREAMTSSSVLVSTIKTEKGRHYVQYGITRRLYMMWHAYRSIIGLASANRKTPLTTDEAYVVSRDVNFVYINVRGLLDNLAWVLLYEVIPSKVQLIKDKQAVGLFGKYVQKELSFESIIPEIEKHRDWVLNQFTPRRDPVAHKMPLSVVPQVLDLDESEEYRTWIEKYNKAVQELDFDSADNAIKRLGSIGTFVPFISHDPDETPIRLYPILPDDIGHALGLFSSVANFLIDFHGPRVE